MRKIIKLFIAFTIVIISVIAFELVSSVLYSSKVQNLDARFSIRGFYVNLLPFKSTDKEPNSNTLDFDTQSRGDSSALTFL